MFQGTKIASNLLPKSFVRNSLSGKSWDTYSASSSAVCLLFMPGESQAQVVLTKRSLKVRTHKGQIGLPGGRREPSDLTPKDTAFRETEEEIGIPRENLTFHGQLAPILGLDGHAIVPILASTFMTIQDINENQDEVELVIPTPWTWLEQSKASSFEFKMFGKTRSSYLFVINEHKVWGLTAKIIFDADLKNSY